MKFAQKLVKVVAKEDFNTQSPNSPKIYHLAEQAIVLIWEEDGYTWCKDVLNNTWFVLHDFDVDKIG